jgi:hypothetical protein
MEIVIFLFGMLAIVPTCLLAMHDQRTRTLHVHHWHHPSSSQMQQEPVQTRYAVLVDDSGPYVLDTNTGHSYAIVKPKYERLAGGK